MTAQQPEVRRARPRPTFRNLRVRRVLPVMANTLRITLTGEELQGYTDVGPASHVRLFFPPPGFDQPVLPEWGPQGPIIREDLPRPVSRVYTPRRWDAATLEVDIDVILHGEGPGSTWAASAKPGDAVVLTGPGGPYKLDPEAAWYVLAADEAGLPALSTILAALPAGAGVRAFVEVGDGVAEQPLDSAAQTDVTWLHRDKSDELPGRLLEAALREAVLPEGNGRVWAACEASIMRDVRRHLLFDRGLDRASIHTHGYWRLGEANHPDHDLGQEI